MQLGRPTKYDEIETIRIAEEYVENANDEEYQVTKSTYSGKNSDGETFETRLRVRIPTIEGLSLELGVCVDTITEWRKIYPNFSAVIKRLLAKQCIALAQNGLAGTYNPTIAKVLLAKHGYRDSVEQEHTNPDGNLKTIVVNHNYASDN